MVVKIPPVADLEADLEADLDADLVFHALGDATRRDIVMTTLQGEHSVSALARRYPMSFAAVQKHVAVLERARLVTKARRGREQLVRGNVDTLRRAARLLDELEALWRGRMDRIADLLTEDPAGTVATGPSSRPPSRPPSRPEPRLP